MPGSVAKWFPKLCHGHMAQTGALRGFFFTLLHSRNQANGTRTGHLPSSRTRSNRQVDVLSPAGPGDEPASSTFHDD